MVKLHPNFHTYFPNKAKNLSYPILEEVQKLYARWEELETKQKD